MSRSATSLSPPTEEHAADIDAQDDGRLRDCELFKLCGDVEPTFQVGSKLIQQTINRRGISDHQLARCALSRRARISGVPPRC
jgi:hypothetical protein